MSEEKNIYPDMLKEALCAAGVPENEADETIDLLTFSLIASL